MEALNAFGVDGRLLLIQGVNFGLLLLLLYKFLYIPLFALLEKRQGVIEQGLKDAEDAAREKDETNKAKDSIMASAREEGGKLIDGHRKQAIEQEKEIVRSAQEKSVMLMSDALSKANDEREHMLRESEKEIAKMAVLATEKLLRAQT